MDSRQLWAGNERGQRQGGAGWHEAGRAPGDADGMVARVRTYPGTARSPALCFWILEWLFLPQREVTMCDCRMKAVQLNRGEKGRTFLLHSGSLEQTMYLYSFHFLMYITMNYIISLGYN